MFDIRRRDFIMLLSGATAWSVDAIAQQASKIWRMGKIKPLGRTTSGPLRGLVNFSVKFQYNGAERTTPVPLTRRAIHQLALEAGLRDVRIGELIGQVITATAERNLFHTPLASS